MVGVSTWPAVAPVGPRAEVGEKGGWVKKSVRLLELLRLSRDRPRTTRDLAASLECSTRTIDRDLIDLRGLGLTVEEDGAGRWHVDGAMPRLTGMA
jgi:predicted DNA-binding transcriptional regulator YafY